MTRRERLRDLRRDAGCIAAQPQTPSNSLSRSPFLTAKPSQSLLK